MRTGPADSGRLSANRDLQGLTPWGVYTAVADWLTAAGLAVIPNCQLMFPGWCCSDVGQDWVGTSAETIAAVLQPLM